VDENFIRLTELPIKRNGHFNNKINWRYKMNFLKTKYLATILVVGLICLLGVFLSSCGLDKEIDKVSETVNAVSDPVERGLTWVAVAIVVNGILRALFNK
jgi:hypothetical protein